MKRLAFVALGLAAAPLLAFQAVAPAQTPHRAPRAPVIPRPILAFAGAEPFTAGGTNFIRYKLRVVNRARFPADMFRPAPDLPPCGVNRNSSRTWLDIYRRDGTRIYGFCALGAPADLNAIWFALPESEVPSRVYVELHDRLTDRRYRSNIILPRKPGPVRVRR